MRDASDLCAHNDAHNDDALEVNASANNNANEAIENAVLSWDALIEGRYQLAVGFSKLDGRRCILARENAPTERAHSALTARERRVVSFALRGHSNKLIAYELGLPQSTVSTVLRSVAMKLGACSRLELVRILASVA